MKDKSNWVIAVFTIVSAIIFGYSVIRPFDKENIIVDASNEFQIGENWGNLNFYHYFHIRNSGEKQGVVTSINGLIISKDNSEFKRYITAKYYLDKSINVYYPIVNITLNPNDKLDSYIQFYKENNKAEKDSIDVLYSNASNEIDSLEKEDKYDYKPKLLSDKTFNSVKKFVSKRLTDFKEGEYLYIISMKKNGEAKPFFNKCYSFVIYQSNLKILNESINNYSKGGGMPLFSNNRANRIIVQLTEIQDTETINSLKKSLELAK